MPHILIHFIPKHLEDSPELIDLVVTRIPAALSSIEAMELLPENVEVSVVPDLLPSLQRTEILIRVQDLLKAPYKPRRTIAVINAACLEVAEVVKEFAKVHIPDCTDIRVFPSYRDPETEGFVHVSIPS